MELRQHKILEQNEDDHRAISEFLEWLEGCGLFLGQYEDPESGPWGAANTIRHDPQKILADYLGLDLGELEQERQYLIRRAQGLAE